MSVIKKKKEKKVKEQKASKYIPPVNIGVGYIKGITKKDAINFARGYIKQKFIAIDISWFAIYPFAGGYLWEAHEGGSGDGYIKQIAEALQNDSDGAYWFPNGDRVYKVIMRNDKPSMMLLSSRDSEIVIDSGEQPLDHKTKMSPFIAQGKALLFATSIMMALSFIFALMSGGFYFYAANPGHGVEKIYFQSLPHNQWPLVENTTVNTIITKLYRDGGRWGVQTRPHHIPELSELQEENNKTLYELKDKLKFIPDEKDFNKYDVDENGEFVLKQKEDETSDINEVNEQQNIQIDINNTEKVNPEISDEEKLNLDMIRTEEKSKELQSINRKIKRNIFPNSLNTTNTPQIDDIETQEEIISIPNNSKKD